MNNIEEAIPYGYFINVSELQRAIADRIASGQPLMGEGIIYQGAKEIIETPESMNLITDQESGVLPIPVRVDIRGKYRLSIEEEDLERFHMPIPSGWAFPENP